jgi:hypothetical protein
MSRKMLVLQTYVYLRDTDSKGFYHETMTENLWNCVAQLTLQSGLPGPSDWSSPLEPTVVPKKPDGTPYCSHCRNATVHNLLGIKAMKLVCVFLTLSQTHARKAASEALALHQSAGGGSLPECCQIKLDKYSKLAK